MHKHLSEEWRRHLLRVKNDPEYAANYKRARQATRMRIKERMSRDPEYAEKVLRQRREWKRNYLRDPAVRKSFNEKLRKKYRESASFREQISINSRRWRQRHRDYDTIRKTISGWNTSSAHRKKKNIVHKKWWSKKSTAEKESIRKKICELGKAWMKRQRNDPEYGWAVKKIGMANNRRHRGKCDLVNNEDFRTALDFYKCRMAERKQAKRKAQIEKAIENATKTNKQDKVKILREIEKYEQTQKILH